MLASLHLQNFTVFKKFEFAFSPQFNIFIGENGTGKSQLLRLMFAVLSQGADEGKRNLSAQPTKGGMQTGIAAKLIDVFRPDSLGRLVKRRQGKDKCQVDLRFFDTARDVAFSFAPNSKTEVEVVQLPQSFVDRPPVFFPTHDVLAIYPGFLSLYESYHVEFDETWRAICLLLGGPELKGPLLESARKSLKHLEEAMGGSIVLDPNGRFYLQVPGSGKMEITLVGEGLRKIAMLCRLILTGALVDKAVLFWDEPEANLNPRLIKLVAQALIDRAHSGVQVFVATHSLFLMREFEILLQGRTAGKITPRIFSMVKEKDTVIPEQGDSFDDIRNVASLDEELFQTLSQVDQSDQH